MKMTLAVIGERVRTMRTYLGMSQDELATRAKTSRGTVWKIENGDSEGVAFGTVLDVLRAVGYDLEVTDAYKARPISYVTSEEYARAAEEKMRDW